MEFKAPNVFTHYPQSNGKAEATANSMKIICMTWNGRFLDGSNSVRHYYSTATHPHYMTDYPQFRNYLVVQCRYTACPLKVIPFATTAQEG